MGSQAPTTGLIEALEERRRARSLAAFFGAGASLSGLVLLSAWLLPDGAWPDLHELGILVTVVLAATTAVVLWVVPDLGGPRVCDLLAAGGTLLIAACQVLAGGGMLSISYSLLYLWVVLHAALFASRWVVAGQVVFAAVAMTVALTITGHGPVIVPALILNVGTQVAAALVVGSLASSLRVSATTDPLTGLGNRRRAYGRLAHELDRSRNSQDRPTCVAVLDLDGFKAYNDERGHLAGDALLVELATTWQGMVRGEDVLTRTGGDEFALVLADCDLEVAIAVVRRLLEHPIGEVTCSAGIARWDGRESLPELLERADRALYRAKLDGPLAVAEPAVA